MFMYEMPTRLYFGKDWVAQSGQELCRLGKRALLLQAVIIQDQRFLEGND